MIRMVVIGALCIFAGWCLGGLTAIGYAAWTLAHGVNP